MSRPLLLTGLSTLARDALASWLGCDPSADVDATTLEAPDAEASRAIRDSVLGLERSTPRSQFNAVCMTRGAWLLEELKEDVDTLRVVAAYEAPWRALDRLFARTRPDLGTSAKLVDQWCLYHEQLLSWRASYPSRCLLFSVHGIDAVFGELQAEVAKLAGVKIRRFSPIRMAPESAESGRAAVFGALLERLSPHAMDVYRELEGCSNLFGREPDFTSPSHAAALNADLLARQWAL